MKSVAATVLAVIVAASAATAQETQTAGMSWSLKAGDQFSTKVVIDINMGMELPGMPMGGGDQAFNVQYQLDHKVTESADGVATVDATIGPVETKITMPMMGDMSYKSAEDDEANPLRGVRHLVGKTFSYKLDKTGKVSGVSGGTALVEEAGQAAAGDAKGDGGGGGMMMIDPAALAMVAMALFQDETLATTIGVHTHVLPGAAGGNSWTVDKAESIATVGTIKFKANCTSEDGSTIKFSGKDVAFEQPEIPADQGNPMAAMQRKLMEGLEVTRSAVSGTATFDKTKGRVVKSESTREIDQEGQLPEELKQMIQMQGGQVQDDMKLVRKSKLTVTVEEISGDDSRRF